MSVIAAADQLIRCFHKYASTDSDQSTISKKELGELLKNEFGGFAGVSNLFCLLF